MTKNKPQQKNMNDPQIEGTKSFPWHKVYWAGEIIAAASLIGYGSSSFAVGFGVFIALMHLSSKMSQE
ncbi:hypothetical protein ACO0LB_17835 [Undibacterium sp. SXout7W]|uniref:hypothetical protein n=1 Tax=Undibacterium sp. SXout7W TaxID=3413049 RepID=UPI003BF0FDE9